MGNSLFNSTFHLALENFGIVYQRKLVTLIAQTVCLGMFDWSHTLQTFSVYVRTYVCVIDITYACMCSVFVYIHKHICMI